MLTSELYGLPSVLPKEVTDKIDERNLLFAKHERSPAEEEMLSALSAELAGLGVLRSYGDPYEQAFVEAMARRREREREREGGTPADVRARNEEADVILERLFADGEGAR